jgi:hypothetical protein
MRAIDAYCGRPRSCPKWFKGPGADGLFGNPYPLDRYGLRALDLFRTYWLESVDGDVDFRRAALALKGKRLGCWCVRDDGLVLPNGDGACHVLFIAEWVDRNG